MDRQAENTPKSVIVVGAGAVGVCCGLMLRKKGLEVTIVDRLPPGEACSYGNAGVLAAWACVPHALPGVLRKAPSWLLDPLGPLVVRWRSLPRLLPWLRDFVASAHPA